MDQNISIAPYWGAEPTFSNLEKLTEFLLEERFTIKDLGVSYTNITYWDKQGILSFSRSAGGRWRNFNFIDFMWIKTVDELREIGISTTLIKAAKKNLFQPFNMKPFLENVKANPDEFEIITKNYSKEEREKLKKFYAQIEKKPTNKKITHFYYAIADAIQLTEEIKLEIFKDGSVILHPFHNLYSEVDVLKVIREMHISISLTTILKNFLTGYSDHITHVATDLKILQPNEIKLLELINSGEYDSIRVIFKGTEMKELELNKTQDAKTRLVDIMKEGAYQNITIKSHKGVVSSIENTIKVKF
ncbi:MAG: MerR family transcriptional regulator [Bacteroidetes bacterium]|nr:MerR family transcriptional regulator [Bacteroidota bacterium]